MDRRSHEILWKLSPFFFVHHTKTTRQRFNFFLLLFTIIFIVVTVTPNTLHLLHNTHPTQNTQHTFLIFYYIIFSRNNEQSYIALGRIRIIDLTSEK